MTWILITRTVIIGVTTAVLAYDVIAAIIGGTKATVSAVLYEAAKKYPVIPLAIGILVGHLFFPV